MVLAISLATLGSGFLTAISIKLVPRVWSTATLLYNSA